MNVQLPAKYQKISYKAKLYAIRFCFIVCGYVLYNWFEFTDDDIADFCEKVGQFYREEKFNKTLVDEAEAWAKKHDFLQEGF